MGVRHFRDQMHTLTEPVTVIRREEILGVWTPDRKRIALEKARKTEG